ncbi:MAG: hypothetical protein OEZ04_10795, partial [Nitrospinota bacterium]|nr:hypothetical protein [Nitrospinota bacterium]
IDGVNEIALPLVHGSFREQFSPFFPDNWRARSETRFPPDRLRIITAIFATKERRYDMANIINRWPFKRSVLVNLLWKRYDEAQKIHHVSLESDLHRYGDSKFTAKTVNIAGQKFKLDYDRSWASENGNQYTTQDGRTFLGPPSGISTERDWYIDSSRYWANCSIMLNNFAASQGAIYLHFIQPNQYFDNKKMGSHEKSVAIQQGSPWGLAVRSGYPYLLIAGDALNKKGVSFFDFSTLFSRETEEIYIDNCCHFNKYGNDILAKAIANKIMISLTADGKAKLAQVPNGNDYDFSLKMLKYYSTNPNSYKDGSDAPVPKYMGALRQ